MADHPIEVTGPQTPQNDEPAGGRWVALLGVVLVAALAVAVPAHSFLVAPLAILLIFCVGSALSDRRYRAAR